MRVKVLSFQPRSGTGTQTITGVADDDGPFEGRYFFFQSAYAALNTVTSGGIPLNAYMDGRGYGVGILGSLGTGVANVCADVSTAGIKDAGAMLDGGYCVSDYNAQLSFGGAGWRHAWISAIASGSFELTYDQNDRTGDTVFCTVFGGTDLDFQQVDLTAGVKATSTKPQGVLSIGTGPLSGMKSALTGTGGEFVNRGWNTREGVRGSMFQIVPFGNANGCVQLTDTIFAQGGAGGVQVTSWDDLAFTVANSGGVSGLMLAVCGNDIRTASGVLTQPLSTGVQDFDTGIDARWICLIGNGTAANAGNTTVAQAAVGWGTQLLDQIGFWTAESGGATTVTGARYLTTSSVLRFGTPNTTSTTFDAVASLTALNSDGSAQLDWTTVDSTPRQVLWFAIGVATIPPSPPPTPVFRTREVVRRRLRRAPIVWSEQGGLQTRVRINLFAVDMQPGVGTSDTPDPLVMIRASKDGGFTWGNERRVSAGRVGEYFNRINAWQWGQGRDWVFEVSCTDPVLWNLVGAYLDAEGGES